MAVRIESEEVTEYLHSNDRAGDGFIFGNRLLKKGIQGIPGATTEIGEEFPSIDKNVFLSTPYCPVCCGFGCRVIL